MNWCNCSGVVDAPRQVSTSNGTSNRYWGWARLAMGTSSWEEHQGGFVHGHCHILGGLDDGTCKAHCDTGCRAACDNSCIQFDSQTNHLVGGWRNTGPDWYISCLIRRFSFPLKKKWMQLDKFLSHLYQLRSDAREFVMSSNASSLVSAVYAADVKMVLWGTVLDDFRCEEAVLFLCETQGWHWGSAFSRTNVMYWQYANQRWGENCLKYIKNHCRPLIPFVTVTGSIPSLVYRRL